MMNFETLLEVYIAGTANRAELDEFIALLPDNEAILEQRILNDLEQQRFKGLTTEKQRAKMLTNIRLVKGREAKIRQMPWVGKNRLWKWAAAASFIILAATMTILLSLPKSRHQPSIAQTPVQISDVKPGHNGAILTLSNGQKLVLDSVAGKIASEGGATAINQNGSISYNPSAIEPLNAVYNTITTPKGRQYQLMLADGSKVWLNAASSIKFPTAFTGKERIVEITGEAYFEVAHDASKPFIVSVHNMRVEVLGTHFNINSYDDEQTIKTTLLQGKVRVTRGASIALLQPGEQAQAAGGELKIDHSPDLEEVMAWKSGLFHFNNASLQEVMRQIERWYDVEVVYQGSMSERNFEGEILRSSNLSQVVKILEESNIHCTIRNNKLLVSP